MTKSGIGIFCKLLHVMMTIVPTRAALARSYPASDCPMSIKATAWKGLCAKERQTPCALPNQQSKLTSILHASAFDAFARVPSGKYFHAPSGEYCRASLPEFAEPAGASKEMLHGVFDNILLENLTLPDMDEDSLPTPWPRLLTQHGNLFHPDVDEGSFPTPCPSLLTQQNNHSHTDAFRQPSPLTTRLLTFLI